MRTLMTRLGEIDAQRRRSNKAIANQYRAIAKVEDAVGAVLNRMLRMRQIHSLANRIVKKTTRGGRIVLRNVVSFDHKPEGKRTRHVTVEFFKKTPVAYAFTDCGPDRHVSRYAEYPLRNDIEIARFYRQEISK
jgi:hypothetical protein